MDEMNFLRELADVSHSISGGTGDIRAQVWSRLEHDGDACDLVYETSHTFSPLNISCFYKLSMAAVIVIVIASGLIHQSFPILESDAFWRHALYYYHNLSF